MSVAANKFNCFVGDVGLKVHNLNIDTLKIMLTDVAPVAGNSVKTDLTEISGTSNGYSAQSVANAYSQSGGIGTLTGTSPTFTQSGANAIGPFRYAVLYNDSAASKNLICWWDLGGEVTLAAASGAMFTPTIGASLATIT